MEVYKSETGATVEEIIISSLAEFAQLHFYGNFILMVRIRISAKDPDKNIA